MGARPPEDGRPLLLLGNGDVAAIGNEAAISRVKRRILSGSRRELGAPGGWRLKEGAGWSFNSCLM